MIINHTYQFCYFAIPRTASQAISKVLIEKFGSEKILKMHASYGEFIEQASTKEKEYFKFTTVRNPLDSVLSAYFKKKTNHNGRFTKGYFKNGRQIGLKAMEEFNFIHSKNASFSEYFQAFHTDTYRIPRHEETVKNMDAIIRFESLHSDFPKLLQKLGLATAVEVPQYNTTNDRQKDYTHYYHEDDIRLALINFAPIMDAWGYDFPVSWEIYR